MLALSGAKSLYLATSILYARSEGERGRWGEDRLKASFLWHTQKKKTCLLWISGPYIFSFYNEIIQNPAPTTTSAAQEYITERLTSEWKDSLVTEPWVHQRERTTHLGFNLLAPPCMFSVIPSLSAIRAGGFFLVLFGGRWNPFSLPSAGGKRRGV